MNILLTGANGFIGKHVSIFFESQKEYTVFKIARSFHERSKNNIELDLTDKNKVMKFAREFKKKHTIDAIIHLAAKMAGSKQKHIDAFRLFDVNLEIAKNLTFIAQSLLPRKLINFSSMAVYPNVDGVFDEKFCVNMSENTDCLYGLAKFCAENIFDHFLKNENMVITHLRVSQVYGDGMNKSRVMPMMRIELKEKNTVTVFGEGKRVSNFIHIDKLLEILRLLVIGEKSGVYNVGDEEMSYLDLAKRIIKENGNEYSRIIKHSPGSRVKFILDTRKLNSALKS
ncbi:MAG TPA: NAD(P)-dependent oxidoreductase [Lentisphaeria bacterium]|nr:MAG: hypothetical protein A2X47_09215 [Lentisphaerae bacterium GWF2_38_69]HBM15422.1 NAD(P)-dependent oxidoreductase [Lentisphaeria bacterium]